MEDLLCRFLRLLHPAQLGLSKCGEKEPVPLGRIALAFVLGLFCFYQCSRKFACFEKEEGCAVADRGGVLRVRDNRFAEERQCFSCLAVIEPDRGLIDQAT